MCAQVQLRSVRVAQWEVRVQASMYEGSSSLRMRMVPPIAVVTGFLEWDW